MRRRGPQPPTEDRTPTPSRALQRAHPAGYEHSIHSTEAAEAHASRGASARPSAPPQLLARTMTSPTASMVGSDDPPADPVTHLQLQPTIRPTNQPGARHGRRALEEHPRRTRPPRRARYLGLLVEPKIARAVAKALQDAPLQTAKSKGLVARRASSHFCPQATSRYARTSGKRVTATSCPPVLSSAVNSACGRSPSLTAITGDLSAPRRMGHWRAAQRPRHHRRSALARQLPGIAGSL